jgi:MYXO-CTERM domain-containing protein
LPSGSSYTFTPNGESVPAGSTGNETVEIATGSSSSSAHQARPGLWPALPLALGLLFAPFALRRRRPFLLILFLALLMGGISSCTSSGIVGGSGGNSGGGGGGGSSTPAGTYSIPITVTSNNISHTVNLTLIVD